MTPEERKFIHDVIDDAIEKKDRYVSLYFGEYGCSVFIYPMNEDEESEELENEDRRTKND